MAIALDAVTNGFKGGGGANSTLSIAHTCTGSNLIMIVAVAFNDSNQHSNQTQSVDYNGTALTQLVEADSGSGKDTRVELWYLLNPTIGQSLNVNIKYSSINYVGAGVMTFTGVKQVVPTISNSATGTASSTTLSVTTIDDNSWTIDVMSCETQPSVTNGGTKQWQNNNQSFQWGQSATKGPNTPAGSVTMGWSNISGNTWSYAMMAISPAVANSVPTVTTDSVTNVSQNSAVGNGTVVTNGGATVTDRGFVLATHSNPTTSDTKFSTSGDQGSFMVTLSGLNLSTTYHVRAYATNSVGTSYGNDTIFTTLGQSPPKRYYYKVYNPNLTYNTTWSSDVITDPTFRTVVNGGAGQLIIQLARKFDNFGENVDVALQNRVELWVADTDAPGGTKLFTGYISAYAPVIDDEQQYVEITVVGFVIEAQSRILKDTSNNTTVTYTGQEIGSIMQDIITKYRADGGTNINYTGSSIGNTGVNVTYTFRANTLKECFDKLAELSPNGWFWYMDLNGNVFLKQASTTADHTLTIGKDVSYLQTTKRIENLINQVFVIGGGNPNYYTEYTRAGSVSTYGKFETKIQDGKITDNTTSDAIAKKSLDTYQNPELRTIIRVIDNNGENSKYGQNIEGFNIGDTIQIKNLNYGAKSSSLWDVAQWDVDVWDTTLQFLTASVLTIVSIVYYPEYIEIEASSRQPEITKRAEDINRLLLTQTQSNLPSAPTVRTV